MEPRIYRIIRLMTIDLRHGLSLNLLASCLDRLFKDETDTSPPQYLKAQRTQKARELPEITFFNAKEVMLKVGVKDKIGHLLRIVQPLAFSETKALS
ncbi:MAG TPA: AraC family transcriptional regulator [Pyrinomonadaceae bacterium]